MEPIVIIIFWLLCGIAASAIADSKGRNGFGWFFLGIIIGPIAILMIGFMPSENLKSEYNPMFEKIIYSEGKVLVTNQKIVFENWSYPIKQIEPVWIKNLRDEEYKIDIHKLSGGTIFTMSSRNYELLQRIKDGINTGINTPLYIQPEEPKIADQGTELNLSPSTKLLELKNMLDKGLITQEEYDKKKENLISRM